MPIQDFRARVPLVTLGSSVPGDYSPLKVKHMNGIVLDRIDNQAEAQVLSMNVCRTALSHSFSLPSPHHVKAAFLTYILIL